MNPQQPFKVPRSVLVVIHTPRWDVLLLRRRNDAPDGTPFWQSVTGSQEADDAGWTETAAREVQEETGLQCGLGWPAACLQDWALENVYPIYPRWRNRYAPGVFFNVERVFGLCVPEPYPVRLSAAEHRAYCWLPWIEAADRCYSASNAEAILSLPHIRRASLSRAEDPCR
ncbi:dihydroneopterin triphosphate diphosphatase [Curvibacter sp. APW13]|uniref:dihydroneopterin triphosphate diphosphatase n=1 Tax=Curvibacter sp. APW13 TaxID=3077236 RepID=UPI0028DFC5B1|nr:dihydroneopterin triphosphate diphosphatase [Curvibacter sp. APW13]MDT8989500.1 dihydroneopterin triphosphate diphosphatase [Curvibacter sp. APW13]